MYRRCFDFVISTDGYAYSATFTRPTMETGPEILPQDIVPNPPENGIERDKVFFVDPGRRMAFVAMEGLSFYGIDENLEQEFPLPAPITKLSANEYYHMAGFNGLRQVRHQKKMRDFNEHGYRYNLLLEYSLYSI
jgi:hypothetical protein